LLHIVTQGDAMSSSEVTEVFFGVTKLFQSSDASLRRMVYFFIKEVAETCNPDDVIIVTSSLTKDMNSKEDLFRANSIRVLAKMIDATMLGAIERYVKQAIVDKNCMVASSALVAGAHLMKGSPDVVRRWVNEVQEALHSPSEMVQFHALSLLYDIKQHDRLAISKMVAQLTRGTISSPLATCLLIRYITTIVRGSDGNVLSSATGRAAYQFLELSLRHRSEAVIYEAAKALCSLPGTEDRDIGPAIAVLQLFLSSPKPTLRLAAMRALSSVAIFKPAAVIKCNDDMESLIADGNRSIATFAITTLLKTGSESSVDRLMKQISSFMNEIADEFKIVVVTAIRELCLKYPLKHRVLVGFLANFLREEGGFDFKKSIVDAIVALMCAIPETKESSLFHLCEFIEDCEFTALSTQILHLVGILGPTTVAPARYIRFVYNRVILENATVRAAAVTALTKFAAQLPALRVSVSVLLRRSLRDEDDEVRDRATFALRLLGDYSVVSLAENDIDAETALSPLGNEGDTLPEIRLLVEPLPVPFTRLARSLKKFEMAQDQENADLVLNFETLPHVEDHSPPTQLQATAQSSVCPNGALLDDSAVELYKIPELAALGTVFRSTLPLELTESETEYVVSCVKHVMDEHIVLEFAITNTIADQLLVDTSVKLEPVEPIETYSIVSSVGAPSLHCGATARSWIVLRCCPGSRMGAAAHFMAELKFRVVEVDPGTGEIEGDEEGFHEEYPLEDVEISTTDFMAKASIGEFRQVWESIDKTQEVLQKFSLQFKDMKVAIAAVIACLGMRPEDHTNDVDDASLGKPHMLHLSGTFAGNICILVRAQLHIEERLGCILKIAVRSSDIEISQLIADCIK
jgi:coatomer protein complex subunit gamma